MEAAMDKFSDENSKLLANIAMLEAKNAELQKENDENLETYAMFKSEAERDIKLQKQVKLYILKEALSIYLLMYLMDIFFILQL